MKTFLQYVAEDLLLKHGTDLSGIALVFPNKRASLFLNEHLAHLAGKPIWSPAYTTISELFRRGSQRIVADPLKLVCDLHRSFTAQTGIDETLDHFFSWGQLLLSDFDDIDKHLAPADKVLANIRDLHEMDDVSYLSEEQKRVIQRFFSSFSDDHNTMLKQRFITLWSHLYDIYVDFNRRLSDQGIAYEGALYREVVESIGANASERLNSEPIPTPRGVGSYLERLNTVIFVGFNLLLPVEEKLFTLLKREGKARFYWDFDRYYMESGTQSEAGQAVRQCLALFPNELDNDNGEIYDNFRQPGKAITFISAPTENIQARYVSQWLKQLTTDSTEGNHKKLTTDYAEGNQKKLTTDYAEGNQKKLTTDYADCTDGKRVKPCKTVATEENRVKPCKTVATPDTAIVLCNEGLLQTVIHCLPEEAGNVNITTGYPLAQSPVASLLTHLIALRTQGYDQNRDRYRLRQVNALLRHPYLTPLSPLLTQLRQDLTSQHIYYPSAEQLMLDEGLKKLFLPFSGAEPIVPQLLRWLCDIIQAVAIGANAPSTLLSESLLRAYTLLNRLLTLVNEGDLQVDVITLQRLMQQLIQATTIPFEGEPLEGLQVMGMLETRSLDFKRILILSCNEGNMPRGINDTSFIPFSLRKAYGLTTPEHKVALQSYYFHRLLQRASEVTIVYNNATTDGQRGEMSRFMLQLMVECPHEIAFHTLRAGQKHIPFQPPTIEKIPEIMEKLTERFRSSGAQEFKSAGVRKLGSSGVAEPLLTPTAINRYQRCPLQFYYNYVCELREPDETEDDVIDNRVFGNIFHEAARIIYTSLMAKSHTIEADDLDTLLHSKLEIEQAVDQAIQKELFHEDGTTDYTEKQSVESAVNLKNLNGLQLINREVIIQYLRQLLQLDRRLAPFTILGLECDVISPMKIGANASERLNSNEAPPTLGGVGSYTQFSTTIGGRIDRLDIVVDDDGRQRIRVVDYKTGASVPKPLPDVESIFSQDMLSQHSDYYLQTFLYACLVKADYKQFAVSPALLFIRHAAGEDYDPTLCFGKEPITDVADTSKRFGELLRQTVDEIFDSEMPFVPTSDRDRCRNCPYKMLCTLYGGTKHSNNP